MFFYLEKIKKFGQDTTALKLSFPDTFRKVVFLLFIIRKLKGRLCLPLTLRFVFFCVLCTLASIRCLLPCLAVADAFVVQSKQCTSPSSSSWLGSSACATSSFASAFALFLAIASALISSGVLLRYLPFNMSS